MGEVVLRESGGAAGKRWCVKAVVRESGGVKWRR